MTFDELDRAAALAARHARAGAEARPSAPRRSPPSPAGRSSGSTRRTSVAAIDYARDLGDPGQFPYTRGIHPTGYRGKLWTMRQFAGFGTPEETNAALQGSCSRPAAPA